MLFYHYNKFNLFINSCLFALTGTTSLAIKTLLSSMSTILFVLIMNERCTFKINLWVIYPLFFSVLSEQHNFYLRF
jgi:hypothetical protein